MPRGVGNITRDNSAPAPVPATVTGTQNGIDLVGTNVELGGGSGKPFLHDTFIDTDGFLFHFGDLDATANGLNFVFDDILSRVSIRNSALNVAVGINVVAPTQDLDVLANILASGQHLGVGNATATKAVYSFASDTDTGLGNVEGAGNVLSLVCGGVGGFGLSLPLLALGNQVITWNGLASAFGGGGDTGISRNAAGLVEVNNGTAGTFRDLQARALFITNTTNLIRTVNAMTNNAGVAAGTLLNAPAAGDPTKWIQIDDAGTARFIPCW